MNFICVECKVDVHVECERRNKGKHTPDCDCQHRAQRR